MLFFFDLIPFHNEFKNIFNFTVDFTISTNKQYCKQFLDQFKKSIELLTVDKLLEIETNKNSFIYYIFNENTEFLYVFQKDIYYIKKYILTKIGIPSIAPFKRVYYK